MLLPFRRPVILLPVLVLAIVVFLSSGIAEFRDGLEDLTVKAVITITMAVFFVLTLFWMPAAIMQMIFLWETKQPVTLRGMSIGLLPYAISLLCLYFFIGFSIGILVLIPWYLLVSLVPTEYMYGTEFLFNWSEAFKSGSLLILAEWFWARLTQSGILATLLSIALTVWAIYFGVRLSMLIPSVGIRFDPEKGLKQLWPISNQSIGSAIIILLVISNVYALIYPFLYSILGDRVEGIVLIPALLYLFAITLIYVRNEVREVSEESQGVLASDLEPS